MAITLALVDMKDGTKRLKLSTPYHPDLPSRARALGGRWNGEARCWYFDERDQERVRETCQEIYGIDPLAPAPRLVTVRLRLTALSGSSLFAFGREILRRPTRDSRVLLGEKVVQLEGTWTARGGSMRYPLIGDPMEPAVLEIRDVPEALATHELPQWYGKAQIVEQPEVPDVPSAREQVLAAANALSQPDQLWLIAELQRQKVWA